MIARNTDGFEPNIWKVVLEIVLGSLKIDVKTL